MRITAVDLFHYDAPFRYGYPSAHVHRMQADSIIIALRCDRGITGYGESVPRLYVTGESPWSVKGLFHDLFIEHLIGREVGSIADVELLLEEIQQACLERRITEFRSALGAVDIALFDALGKYQASPVWKLLGSELRRELPWSISMPILPEEVIRKYSSMIVGRNFSSIKVLVNRDVTQNIERLNLVRELFGEDFPLRIEVNGHWTREEAHANLSTLKKFGIIAVEQPLPMEDIEGLKELRKTFEIPIIVDESMCGPADAEALIERGACDILNIKISKVGGLLAARRIASLAASRGIPCQVGSHVGETGILTAAAMHFLVTAPGLTLVEGISAFLFEDISKIGEFDLRRFIDQILATPGLGFDPETMLIRERLKRL